MSIIDHLDPKCGCSQSKVSDVIIGVTEEDLPEPHREDKNVHRGNRWGLIPMNIYNKFLISSN